MWTMIHKAIKRRMLYPDSMQWVSDSCVNLIEKELLYSKSKKSNFIIASQSKKILCLLKFTEVHRCARLSIERVMTLAPGLMFAWWSKGDWAVLAAYISMSNFKCHLWNFEFWILNVIELIYQFQILSVTFSVLTPSPSGVWVPTNQGRRGEIWQQDYEQEGPVLSLPLPNLES